MKKAKLFSLLAVLLLFAGNAMADELFYTLWTVPFTEGTNHTDYSKYFDDEHDGMIWNAPGNQSLEGKWRIGGKSLDESMNRRFRGQDITRTQWTALYYIDRIPDITQKELAEAMMISGPSASNLVDRLETAGRTGRTAVSNILC